MTATRRTDAMKSPWGVGSTTVFPVAGALHDQTRWGLGSGNDQAPTDQERVFPLVDVATRVKSRTLGTMRGACLER